MTSKIELKLTKSEAELIAKALAEQSAIMKQDGLLTAEQGKANDILGLVNWYESLAKGLFLKAQQ